MGADFSRVRFNPLLDYAGVELEQGRVLLDADANELMAIVDRRLRALASDTLGRATVSSTTPDAFKITAAAGTLLIGKGRLYVDGLLAENHGAASADPAKRLFDDLLGEPAFADPIRYDAQPYLPNPPALPTTGHPPRLPRRLEARGHASRATRPGRERGGRRHELSPADRLAGPRARRRRRRGHHLRVARCRRAGLERDHRALHRRAHAPAPSTSLRWTTRASCRRPAATAGSRTSSTGSKSMIPASPAPAPRSSGRAMTWAAASRA